MSLSACFFLVDTDGLTGGEQTTSLADSGRPVEDAARAEGGDAALSAAGASILFVGGRRGAVGAGSKPGWGLHTLVSTVRGNALAPFTAGPSPRFRGRLISSQLVGSTFWAIGVGHDEEFPYSGDPFKSYLVRTTLSDDGATSAWSLAQASLPYDGVEQPYANGATIVVGAKLFHLGGVRTVDGGSTFETGVLAASYGLESGIAQPFAPAPGVTLAAPRRYFSVVTTDKLVFVVGGAQLAGNDAVADVEVATIDRSKGEVGPFSTTTTLPYPVRDPGLVIHRGYVYVVGGFAKQVLADVLFAKIGDGGKLGEWQRGPNLPRPLAASAIVAEGDRLFCIGGRTVGNPAELTDAVYAITVSNGALVGDWSAAGQPTLPFLVSDLGVLRP